MASDVLDILEIEEIGAKKTLIDRKALLNRTEKKKNIVKSAFLKRPDHIPREVWGLQNTFKNELPPLIPAVETPIYKQPKAIIGAGRVRRWNWVPFTNSARNDSLILHHWRREDADQAKDYHFARLNKHVEVPIFSDMDYKTYLQDSKWTLAQTNHLMDLARLFDVRFIHMHDRWDAKQFAPRPTVEELKARYYEILAKIDKLQGTNLCQGLRYDVDHERKRKQQLSLLYGRSRDEVDEEEKLLGELNRIEARRRDREKKKQDLQRLISQTESVVRESFCDADTAADESTAIRRLNSMTSSVSSAPSERKRSATTPQSAGDGAAGGSVVRSAGSLSAGLSVVATALSASLAVSSNLTFPDLSKTAGVHLHSQRMKLPSSLGQKRIRVIENFLAHYQLDPSPPATGEIVDAYNRLRGNILLLYDLRGSVLLCDYELQAARARMELLASDRPIPRALARLTSNPPLSLSNNSSQSGGGVFVSGNFVPPGVDQSIVAALKAADSKRPVPPRHSLGQAGSLAAAAGCGQASSSASPPLQQSSSSLVPGMSPSSSFGGGSPNYLFDQQPALSSAQRRKRAAATEQGRVMKKLKTRGHILD